jgi:outer membrane cobalamin receptor
MKGRFALLLGGAMWALPVHALARDFAANDAAAEDDAIVVSASTPLSSVGDSGRVLIDAKALRAIQAIALNDALARQAPGVVINEIQGNPLQSDLSFRGYTASPLLGTPQGMAVYVDGVRANQPFGEVVSWDLLPSVAVDQVALIEGAAPQFGRNALGGALNIRTKDGRSAPGWPCPWPAVPMAVCAEVWRPAARRETVCTGMARSRGFVRMAGAMPRPARRGRGWPSWDGKGPKAA